MQKQWRYGEENRNKCESRDESVVFREKSETGRRKKDASESVE